MNAFSDLSTLLTRTVNDPVVMASFQVITDGVSVCIRNGNTLFTAGNGGSAAEAQHCAGEFIGRFMNERRSLPAIALTADSVGLTAIANDYGYEQVFARQIEGLGKTGDVLLLLSTSGNSTNLIAAAEAAQAKGIQVFALLGKGGGALLKKVDAGVVVPSDVTARIQEIHLLLIHELSAAVEVALTV